MPRYSDLFSIIDYIEEFIDSIESSTDSTEELIDSIEDSTESTEELMKSIEDSTEIIEELMTTIEDSTELIEELIESTIDFKSPSSPHAIELRLTLKDATDNCEASTMRSNLLCPVNSLSESSLTYPLSISSPPILKNAVEVA